MIVAASASDGQSHQRARDDLDRIGHDFVARNILVDSARPGTVGCHAEEASRSESFDLVLL